MAKKKLNLPRIAPSADAPFAEDKIGRQPLADRITQVLEDAEDAVVLAVDGGWGTGKSTFARMLQAHLDGRGFRTAYIDAFAVDYVEDPFVPIFARLQALIDQDKDLFDKSEDVLKKAARVLGTLLSKAGSAAVNMAVQAGMLSLTGAPLLGAEKLGDKAAESWEEVSARRIMGFLKEEQYIEEYKAALTATDQAYYEKHDKPLVIFIDELDRCRPDFAVLFLERIKHFFEVPHIAFVLIIHRDQLEKSIRGCYGAEIDARTYLQKFITLTETIDPVGSGISRDYCGPNHNPKPCRETFMEEIFRGCGLKGSGELADIVTLVREFNLSMRDLEKVHAIIRSSQIIFEQTRNHLWHEMFVSLVILRVKDYDLYRTILANQKLDYDPILWNRISGLVNSSLDRESVKFKNLVREFNSKKNFDPASFWTWARDVLEPRFY